MFRIITALLLLLSIPAAADTVELFRAKLSWSPPPGFSVLSADEIAAKFPRQNAPQHVYGNANRSVTVAFTHSSSAVTEAQLPELQAFLAASLGSKAERWIGKDMLTLNGRRWFRLCFVSQALDTTVRNEILGASLEGRALLVNFNATEKDYETFQKALERSKASLTIR
ncbi:MAG: hypothetical protein HY319_13575 [Armatimonadetes bacterium]|nr:hypothetical protein [Armatimonadota bacterium]